MNIDLEELLKKDLATRVIESLSPEQKNAILAESIARTLERLSFDYEARKLLEGEALKFAAEYVKRPEVQERLKLEAVRVVDSIMSNIAKVIGEAVEDRIKSQYQRLWSEKA